MEQINSDDLVIVLDGLQRLTSLYLGLKGSKSLFTNLRYEPKEENPTDIYKFKFLHINNIPEVDENNYWFIVDDILDLECILNYAWDNSLTGEEGKILDILRGAFCSKILISSFEVREKNFDEVYEMFIRVNGGGM